MRVYCDIDDVLAETARTLCLLAERLFGVRCAYEEVTSFNLRDVFRLNDDDNRVFMEAAHEAAHLKSYPIVTGAVEGLRALSAAGCAIDLVTGRPASSHEGTRAWLDAAGLGAYPVIYADKYARTFSHRAGEPETIPFDALAECGYDVAIDDSPVALERLAAWTKTRVIVFDRPWNRAFSLAPNMTRCGAWPAIVAQSLQARALRQGERL